MDNRDNIHLYAVRKAGQLKSNSAPWLLEMSSSAQHGRADSSLHTHLPPNSPDKWSKNGTHIFKHRFQTSMKCVVREMIAPLLPDVRFQTLPHVWNENKKKKKY